MLVSLEILKAHVRADDFADDDQLLRQLLTSAEAYVLTATNRTHDEVRADASMARTLSHAVLMLAAHWYNQPETASGAQMHDVPYGAEAIIKQNKKLC